MALAKVMLVEDDLFTRSSIESILKMQNFAVQSFATADMAMRNWIEFAPEVVILDIDLGFGPTGVDLANQLRLKAPNLGIVFLTSYRDIRFSRAFGVMMPVGAAYFIKGDMQDFEKLTTSILRAKYQPRVKQSGLLQKSSLNDRQVQIVRYVASGLTNAEISKILGSSEKAVEHAISRIAHKLEIPKRESLNPRVQLVHAFAELSGKPLPK